MTEQRKDEIERKVFYRHIDKYLWGDINEKD